MSVTSTRQRKMFVNGYFKVVCKRQHVSMKSIFYEHYLKIVLLCIYVILVLETVFFHKQKTEKEPWKLSRVSPTLALSRLGWISICWGIGGCPVHCRMFGSILGLYPVDVSSTSPVVTTKIVCKFCQMRNEDWKIPLN